MGQPGSQAGFRLFSKKAFLQQAASRRATNPSHNLAGATRYKRPLPVELFPHFSNAPLPLAWLMSADMSSSEAFWEHINARLEQSENLWIQVGKQDN